MTDFERRTRGTAESLTTLSYNVHECVGSDGRRNPARVAEVIKSSGAEIIGLQEVHSDTSGDKELHQMNYLAEAVGFAAVAGPALERRNGQYGNVLLTSGEILAVRELDLSVTGREPRGAIDADLRIAGQDIRVFVAHLGLRGVERRFQVQRLLQSLAKGSTLPIILLGDINEWFPGSRALRWLENRLGRTPRPKTFPAHFPLLALDRIWVTPPLSMERVAIVDTPLARVASDHLPLRATIRRA